MKFNKIYFLALNLEAESFVEISTWESESESLYLSCVQIQPVIAYSLLLPSWKIGQLIGYWQSFYKMEKRKKSQKYHESFYEYRNSLAIGFPVSTPPS